MTEEMHTKSAEETQQFANNLAQKLHGGDVLLLYGNLGAGKTTFVQGLANGLGIERRIISPTFIILRTYEIPSLSSRAQPRDLSQVKEISRSINRPRNDSLEVKNFYHVDLYRLQSEREIEDIGLPSFMGDKENIVVIEWPERLGSLIPKNAWKLFFENEGEDKRKIRVERE